MGLPRVPRLRALVCVVYFAAVAGALWWVVPPFETPDEPDHLAYVSFVAERRALPNQRVPAQTVENEGTQPPLYYVLAAAIVRALASDATVDVRPACNLLHVWNGGPRADVPFYHHWPEGAFVTPSDRRAFFAVRLLSVLLGVATVAVYPFGEPRR
jgi:hypothetical protein